MGRKFKPGESGNPLGAARGKAFTDALRLVAHEEVTVDNEDGRKPRKVKRLRLVAEALVTQAANGDVSAIREFYDRLEGKVPQVNITTETPLDSADTSALETLQGTLEDIINERASGHPRRDSGEAIH